MERKKNFFAGPSVLPVEVLKELQDQMFEYQGQGLSMIEASHRGGMFEDMYDECLAAIRELYHVPADYDVYFLGGGATLQFTMIPWNFLRPGTVADYIKSGTWSNKATEDAMKLGQVNLFYDGTKNKFTSLPNPKEVHPSKNSSYLYFCANETIGGIEWQSFPSYKEEVPMIADMSSDFFSRPVPVERFGMIYGGVQKNLGPAGATLIIMKKTLLEKQNPNMTAYMDYSLHSKDKGLYNTPPVFSIWGVKLVMDWIKKCGGVEAMEKRAIEKSSMVYKIIDSSDFFHSPVDKAVRSRMNIVFRLPNEDLEKKFVDESKSAGMLGLKGHRSVGGLRASLYNACPKEDVIALCEFMKDFEKRNG